MDEIMFRVEKTKGFDVHLHGDLDLRTSFSEKQIILPAVDNLDLLTEQQTMLWNLFYPDGIAPHPLQKSDIKPDKMVAALPYIWMYDFVFDDAGALSEIDIRIHGTRMDEIYGSAAGDHYLVSDYMDKIKDGDLDENARTIEACIKLAEMQIPLIVYVKQLSGELSHLGEMNLILPVCNNSDRVNLLFAHTEVMPSFTDE